MNRNKRILALKSTTIRQLAADTLGHVAGGCDTTSDPGNALPSKAGGSCNACDYSVRWCP